MRQITSLPTEAILGCVLSFGGCLGKLSGVDQILLKAGDSAGELMAKRITANS